MKKFLNVILAFASFFFLGLPAAGQHSLPAASQRSLDAQLFRAVVDGADGSQEVVLLLKKGANIEAKEPPITSLSPLYEWTPLMRAAALGKARTVKLLLENGANVETKDKDGETALMMAATGAVAQLLLDKGANIDARDKHSNTPLIQAAISGHAEVEELLLDKGANIEATDDFKDTALIMAAVYGKADAARLLLEKGANIEATNDRGETALLLAAGHGEAGVVKLLLERGANPDATDSSGDTALFKALENPLEERSIGALNSLLEKGANIEARNSLGDTALIYAATRGKISAMKLLLEKGANIEARGLGNTTALIASVDPIAGDNAADLVKLLLEKGADLEARDKDGHTALDLANQKKSRAVADLLEQAGRKRKQLKEAEAKDPAGQHSQSTLSTRLYEAIEHGDVNAARQILDEGADIERVRAGTRPLTLAVLWGRTEMTRLLLDRGAKIEATDELGETALLLAVCKPSDPSSGTGLNPDLVKLLLDNGANLGASSAEAYFFGEEVTKGNRMILRYTSKPLGGFTPRGCAQREDANEIVDLIDKASWQRKILTEAENKEPKERLAFYANAYRKDPKNEALRKRIFVLAAEGTELPAVPEEARQLFALATSQITQARTPQALVQPIGLLRKTLEIAPWWANAYYNYSRALELSGQYDEASKQLNYYLKLNPPESDAREARAHLIVIQTEKEAAAQKP
jgi:ankyrin repeat protein